MVDTNSGEDAVYHHIMTHRPDSTCTRHRLDVGDVEISCGGTKVCIERKTWTDLAASICDGRFKEQKTRMVASEGKVVYLYVIEAERIPSWDDSHRGMFCRAMWGAIVKTSLRDGFQVLHTASTKDTASLCIYIADQLNIGAFVPNASKAAIAGVQKRKRDNLTDPRLILRAMLATVPGMSVGRADQVLGTFPNVRALCAAKVTCLANLECGDRRLGPKMAAKLKEIFPSDEDDA